MKPLVILLFLATPALAAEQPTFKGTASGTLTFSTVPTTDTYIIVPDGEPCPADRPIRRKVVVWGTMLCNSSGIFKLTCPSDPAEPCSYMLVNTCPPPPVNEICFTQEQLDKVIKK